MVIQSDIKIRPRIGTVSTTARQVGTPHQQQPTGNCALCQDLGRAADAIAAAAALVKVELDGAVPQPEMFPLLLPSSGELTCCLANTVAAVRQLVHGSRWRTKCISRAGNLVSECRCDSTCVVWHTNISCRNKGR